MSKKSRVGIILLIITCASKVAALLLTLFFSRAFGADLLTDAYYAASTIPNLVNNSLTVCSLTLFIPLYTECKSKHGQVGADEFSSSVLNTYTIFNFILTILVCVLSSLLAKLVAPGFDAEGLYHTRNMICLLSLSFSITISTQVLINICNANSDHLVQASLTLLNHVLTIVLLITIAPRLGIYSYPFMCIGAWLVQLLLQSVYTKRYFKHSYKVFISNNYLKTMLKLSVPVIIATASEQINLAVDNIICSTLSSGSISYLGYSHKIHTAVIGTFTAVLMTMFYPVISRDYSSRDRDRVHTDIKKYIDVLFILVLPVSLFLIIESKDIIHILYGGGSITEDGLTIVSALFLLYSSGLLFAAIKELTTKLFYVIQKTRIPMIISIICVGINIILSITLKNIIGIYGIALATTIATLICSLIECLVLIRKTGGVRKFLTKNIINTRNYLQVFISAVLSTTAVVIVKRSLLFDNYFLSVLLFAVIFFSVYIVTLLVERNEYCNLKMLLGFRKQ